MSNIRKMMQDSYIAYGDLAEARQHADAWLIMEGDFGGQIYLTMPVRLVKCDEPTLKTLLQALDQLRWKNSEGAAIFYEAQSVGIGVYGGMGGGMVIDRLWVHEDLEQQYDAIDAVLSGQQTELEMK